MAYIQTPKNQQSCIFCKALEEDHDAGNLIIFRGKRVFVLMNRYPYTSGHVMVVPYAHQPSLEKLDPEARAEIMELASQCIQVIQEVYNPQGFNLGINIGEAAGAGIADHVHLHVVPRWQGDTNFMSTLGMTRVLPESLEDTYQRLKTGWENLSKPHQP